MQNPFQAQAMIHSLNSKRDVLILSLRISTIAGRCSAISCVLPSTTLMRDCFMWMTCMA